MHNDFLNDSTLRLSDTEQDCGSGKVLKLMSPRTLLPTGNSLNDKAGDTSEGAGPAACTKVWGCFTS